jgi:hemerythrin-like domain-containing protein
MGPGPHLDLAQDHAARGPPYSGIRLPELETTVTMSSQVSRMLDDEHAANVALLCQLQLATSRCASFDATHRPLMAQVVRLLEHEVGRHFGFEEEQLFPRLQESGDGGLALLLQEEHESIRAVGADLLPLARNAAGGTIDDAGWTRLRPLALELAERLTAHIDKETQALLPLVDDLLEEETDRELAFAYSAA